MRKPFVVLSALTLLAPLACELQLNQLRANKVMVGTFLSSPQVTVDAALLVSSDAGVLDGGSLPSDAGLPDAGSALPDGGVVTLPGQTAVSIFFGSRGSTAFNSTPVGVEKAEVTFGQEGQTPIVLKDEGNGNYRASADASTLFTYEKGKNYLFTATSEEEEFVGEVADAPANETIAELHPAEVVISHPANTPFTLSRSSPNDSSRSIGFVTVLPFALDGTRGNSTYTNMPSSPGDFLNLIANPKKWKEDKVVIPATAFPDADATYLILFQAAKLGGPKSDNLFTGSALLAGAADIGVVKTK